MRFGKFEPVSPFLDQTDFLLTDGNVLIRVLGKDPEHAVRLERESLLLASLDQPSVPKAIEFGEVEAEGTLYYSMQLPGPLSLPKPRDPSCVMRLLLLVSRALADLHGAGVVYRKVAPSGIALTIDGEPILYDFSRATRMSHKYGAVQSGVPELSVGIEADLFGLRTLGESLSRGMELRGTPLGEALEYMKADSVLRRVNSLSELVHFLEQH